MTLQNQIQGKVLNVIRCKYSQKSFTLSYKEKEVFFDNILQVSRSRVFVYRKSQQVRDRKVTQKHKVIDDDIYDGTCKMRWPSTEQVHVKTG